MKLSYNMLKRAFNQGNLVFKIYCWISIKLGFSNKNISILQIRYRYYLKLKKEYLPFLNHLIDTLSRKKEGRTQKVIWLFWYDGFADAPVVVQKCIKSIYKYKRDDYQIILITKDNIRNYASIPEFIYKKLKNNEMSMTHFSDILRFNLLATNGGVWMDSTVLLTKKLPDLLAEHDFFVFSNENRNDLTVNFDSWFIVAKKGNVLIDLTLKMIYEYWRNEKKLHEYFLVHLFFTMVTEQLPTEWETADKITTLLPHELQFQMLNKFNSEKWNQMVDRIGIHKLTYKYSSKDVAGSYLDYILRGNFND